MFISCQETKECCSKNIWLLDNGCNNHMTCKKELLSSLDNNSKFKIKLGHDHLVDALGKGIVIVLSKQNETKDIPNVYYVQCFET